MNITNVLLSLYSPAMVVSIKIEELQVMVNIETAQNHSKVIAPTKVK